ncbi:MAG: DUF2807 domain-containing protein [Pseudomonadota bacterium]
MISTKLFSSALAIMLSTPAILAAAEEKRQLGPYDAAHVTLQSLVTDLQVVPGDALTIVLTGDAKTVDAVEVEQSGDELTLTQPPTQVSTVVMGPGATITNQGGSITIGGKPIENLEAGGEMSVEVTLPPKTSLTIADFVGSGAVHDLDAPLEIVLQSGRIDAGRVGPAVLEIPGSGTITLKTVRQRLDVSIPGSGTVEVDGGDVDDVQVDIAGSGDVRYDGTARTAKVGVYGAGDVTLGPVDEKPDITMAGGGDVKISNW